MRGASLLDVAVRAAIGAGASRHVVASVASATARAILTAGKAPEDEGADPDVPAHADLHALNGAPSHSLGLATKAATDKLTSKEQQVLHSLRRKANKARHHWPGLEQSSPLTALSPAQPHIVET